jgi:benzodiazapine receptor
MKGVKVRELAFSVIVCQLAGIVGSIFTTPAIGGWYATLEKPWFNPPNWVFAPVWTALFLMMGLSLYLILIRKDRKTEIGLLLFSAQLLLNILWSVLFFGLKDPLFAFLEILALWFFILLTAASFWRIDRRATYLLIPYLCWVSFATILNFYIWKLNAGL